MSMILFVAGFGEASLTVAAIVSAMTVGLDVFQLNFLPHGALFNVISSPSIAFNGDEAKEVLLEPMYRKEDLNAFHDVIDGVTVKTQVVYGGLLGNSGVADPGCASTTQTNTSALSEQFYDPVRIEIHLKQCYDQLTSTPFARSMGTGTNLANLVTNEAFVDFALELLSDSATEAVWRLAWLGDKDAVSGGYITNAATEPYYTPLDGYWTHSMDAVTASTMTNVEGPMKTANDQTTSALQLSNYKADTDATYQTLISLIEEADQRLADQNDLNCFLTTEAWWNWINWKESQGFDRSFERQDVGFRTDVFRGVKLWNFSFLSKKIKSDMDNGTKHYKRHRAMLTTKENLKLVMGATTDYTSIDIWYEKLDKTTHMRVNWEMDAKIAHNFMAIVAY